MEGGGEGVARIRERAFDDHLRRDESVEDAWEEQGGQGHIDVGYEHFLAKAGEDKRV
jgi:hypothetical protein